MEPGGSRYEFVVTTRRRRTCRFSESGLCFLQIPEPTRHARALSSRSTAIPMTGSEIRLDSFKILSAGVTNLKAPQVCVFQAPRYLLIPFSRPQAVRPRNVTGSVEYRLNYPNSPTTRKSDCFAAHETQGLTGSGSPGRRIRH
jgi:hypothetical protein